MPLKASPPLQLNVRRFVPQYEDVRLMRLDQSYVGYLSDHFYGESDLPCIEDGVRLVLTFSVIKPLNHSSNCCYGMGWFMEEPLKASIQHGSSFRPVVSYALVAEELALKTTISAALAVGFSRSAYYSDWQEFPFFSMSEATHLLLTISLMIREV
ncbi:unnamed protein product [Arabidopsis arenosa]|uniref:Uncharacterized protein n=1 Tax=Arabidopsis arenosa TaxID=38785 RepID=A0A8S2A4H2_ARAAE|nr:unnamed protein product [Arabidopsis arenosa]